MNWNFSIGWVIFGLILLAAGAAIVVFYRQIADGFTTLGIAGYDKVKLFGIVIGILGLIIMTNLHTFLLNAFVQIVFKR